MNDFNPGYNGYNYNPGQRQGYYQPMQQPGIICRLVGSYEEFVVSPMPADGTVGLFIDRTADKIYTKTFQKDGRACLQTYSRDMEPPAPQYATAQDMAEMRGIIGSLREEIERLKKPGKAAKKDDAE